MLARGEIDSPDDKGDEISMLLDASVKKFKAFSVS